jgi:hypothetical protein
LRPRAQLITRRLARCEGAGRENDHTWHLPGRQYHPINALDDQQQAAARAADVVVETLARGTVVVATADVPAGDEQIAGDDIAVLEALVAVRRRRRARRMRSLEEVSPARPDTSIF